MTLFVLRRRAGRMFDREEAILCAVRVCEMALNACDGLNRTAAQNKINDFIIVDVGYVVLQIVVNLASSVCWVRSLDVS